MLPVRKRPAVLATEGHRFSLGCPGVSCDAQHSSTCRCFLTMDGSYLSKHLHVLLAVSVAADNQCGSDCRRGGGGGIRARVVILCRCLILLHSLWSKKYVWISGLDTEVESERGPWAKATQTWDNHGGSRVPFLSLRTHVRANLSHGPYRTQYLSTYCIYLSRAGVNKTVVSHSHPSLSFSPGRLVLLFLFIFML